MTDTLKTHDIEKIHDLDEPRLFDETGLDARIAQLITPVIKPLGFRLVRVRMSGLNGLTLQIMAERADGTFTINDCEVLSKTISPVLDVEDLIDKKYNLEVSSPGIDRPLVRRSDFINWIGHIAKVETDIIIDSRKKFRGVIQDIENEHFILKADKTAYGEALEVRIPFAEVNHANLVLTDDLIRAALKKDKEARQKLIPDDNLGQVSDQTSKKTQKENTKETTKKPTEHSKA